MAFVVASTAVSDLVRGAPRTARVVAVLPAAVYLEVPATPGPRWLALLARDAVRVPIGLVTALPRARRPFHDLGVGDLASIGAGELCLHARRTAGRHDAGYRPLRYWDPTAPALCGALAGPSPTRRGEALAQLIAVLPDADAAGWAERALDLEAALAPPVPASDRVAATVGELVGLGPGLTPAGDDVLAGVLVTLAAAADEPRRAALAHAVTAALPRTAPISAALLAQACRGRTVPEVAALLRAIAGSGDLDAALTGLALVGHTSGAALALGVRAALRARARDLRPGRPLRSCA
ncbi:MAG TPA: DUF2877 domain-containing protein [Kineosporiaceae bacterium]